ncbi:acyltransferase family protein [Candidatus Dojkabacteria bacterium]|nr:acyltransferase family protein [Candidatus Dojkabacteria bacterium]
MKKKERDYSLDFLRGMAVVFMVLTHVNAVLYKGYSTLFSTITWWGATICYTTFLFVFGAVYGIKIQKEKMDRIRMLKRATIFLIIYFASAFSVILVKYGIGGLLENIGDILFLSNIPEFTEFLLPFVFYLVIFALFTGSLIRMKSWSWGYLLVGVLLFIISDYLYDMDWGPNFRETIKGLFVGHEDVHTFGLLSYAPILMTGLYWGVEVIGKGKKNQIQTLLLSLLCGLFLAFLNYTAFSSWNRWPPSVVFLLYGIVFCLVVLFLYGLVSKAKVITKPIIYLGQHSLSFYYVQIVLTLIIGRLLNWRRNDELWALLMYLVSFVVTWLILVTFNIIIKRISPVLPKKFLKLTR